MFLNLSLLKGSRIHQPKICHLAYWLFWFKSLEKQEGHSRHPNIIPWKARNKICHVKSNLHCIRKVGSISNTRNRRFRVKKTLQINLVNFTKFTITNSTSVLSVFTDVLSKRSKSLLLWSLDSFLWGPYAYKISMEVLLCSYQYVTVNLFYVNLFTGPAREARRQEGKIFPP